MKKMMIRELITQISNNIKNLEHSQVHKYMYPSNLPGELES